MQWKIPGVWVVVAVAGLTFFLGLGSGQLFDEDEPKNAECGREMFERGDWIVPTFNHELRTEKPVLVYWFMLVSFHLFGVSEFAARFFSAVLGIGTCVFTYYIGCRLFNRRAGLWAGMVLGSCLMFTAVARASTPDSTLIFFTTLSLLLYVRSRDWSGAQESITLPQRWYHFLPMYATMAIAVLAKGPVGVLLPCCVIGLFAYMERIRSDATVLPAEASRMAKFGQWFKNWLRPVPFFKTTMQMRPDLILLCVAVIALPWYIAVGVQTDGAWLRGFLGNHNVGRFMQPMENHSGPPVYYLIAIMLGFFPWSVFLPLAFVSLSQRHRQGEGDRQSIAFVLGWAGVYIIFFSLARTKLPNYVLPCYPALALLTGYLFEACPWDISSKVAKGYRWAIGSLLTVGGVLIVALPITAYFIIPGEYWLGVVGIVPLVGGIIAWRQFHQHRENSARQTVLVTCVLFVAVFFGFAGPRVSQHQDGAYIVKSLPKDVQDSASIATFRYSPPGLVYYAQRKIDVCRTPEDVQEYLSDRNNYLATHVGRWEEIKDSLPKDVTIITQKQRFLRDHDIIVIGRSADALDTSMVAEEPSGSVMR